MVLSMTVYDHDLLLKFAKAFPDSSLTDFIDDYCRWFHLPLPEPEGEAAEDAEPIDGDGEAKPKAPAPKKGRGGKRGRAGLNARERRKARRLAEKDGVLSEDLDQEERDELVASMTVSSGVALDADCRRNC
jgi:superkiller protein 3